LLSHTTWRQAPRTREIVISFRLDRGTASKSDRYLIKACRKGQVEAWRALLDKYERIVFAIPRRYGLSVDDAADVTQLTFTILVESIDKLPEDSKLGGWLTTVARRHTWRLLERNRRQGVDKYAALDEGIQPPTGGDTDTLENWELGEWLDQELSKIGEFCRNLLFALYLDPGQPSYAEVAARLGMAVGSVGPTRMRCLERLRRRMDE
jgi:RNA polymerase sigma factor (sigma-70 family)